METYKVSSVKETPISPEDVPLLTRESYTTWKEKMEEFLKNNGLWGYVDGTIHEDEDNNGSWGYVDGTIHEDEDSSKIKVSWLRDIFEKNCEATTQPYIKALNIRFIWSQLATMYEFTHPTNAGMKMKSTRYTWCLPFYTAITAGDWETVSEFHSNNKGALTAIITSEGEYPLHVAVAKRQVNLANELINIMSAEDLSKQRNYSGRTALHIAASDGNIEIVKAIVEKDEKLVTIQSKSSNMSTPIMVAASAGKKEVVNYLYPITIRQVANQKGEHETAKASFLNNLIYGDFYGLALDLLQKYPSLVLTENGEGWTIIYTLSRRPSAFPSSFPTERSRSGKLGYYFQKFMYSLLDVDVDAKNACWHIKEDAENSLHTYEDSTQENIVCGLCTSKNCIIFRYWRGLRLWFHTLCQNALKLVPGYKNIYYEKLKHYEACELLKEIWRLIPDLDRDPGQHDPKVVEDVVVEAMFVAIENGIVEFIEEIINNWPQLLSRHPVFHCAISHRQGKIFGLIHDLGALKYDLARKWEGGNLLSHQAAIKAPTQILNQVSGAALQMQRELLWFKEVDNIMFLNHHTFKNETHQTPRSLFMEEHKDLVKEGATWMKETATQCMVVATLISTIMFQALFTIPGVGKSDHDYIHGKFPIIFATSNILALCFSVASILMFLTIITSRYAEEDFLWSLPQKLMMGLFFLFVSIVGMMVAFVAAILVMLPSQVLWVSFPITLMAAIPITLYALVELPLFFQLIFNTSASEVFGKRKK